MAFISIVSPGELQKSGRVSETRVGDFAQNRLQRCVPIKMLAVMLTIGLATTGSARGQGIINASNNSSQPILVSTNADGSYAFKIGDAASALPAPRSVVVGLWVGPNGATNWSQLTRVGTTLAPATTNYSFALGQFRIDGNYALPPEFGFDIGEIVSFGYQAWSDLTVDDPLLTPLSRGFYGHTEIAWNYMLAWGAVAPSSTFGTLGLAKGQVTGFTMTPVVTVPEPSLCRVASAGIAAVLSVLFRKGRREVPPAGGSRKG